MIKVAEFTIEPKQWAVVKFAWGTAVKHTPTGKWYTLFLFPDAKEIDVQHLDVVLHDNGIEFIAGHS